MGVYSQFIDKQSVLFCTDVLERGLDFDQAVDWVVQVNNSINQHSELHNQMIFCFLFLGFSCVMSSYKCDRLIVLTMYLLIFTELGVQLVVILQGSHSSF